MQDQYYLFYQLRITILEQSKEILEKYVILNQLIEKRTPLYLESGVNPFSNTVFHGLFKEKYGNSPDSVKQILADYEELNEKYSLELHKLQNYQIERIGDFPLIWRPNVEQFSESIKRIEEKPNNYNYEFVIGKISRKKRDRIVNAMLLKTLVELLRERERAGISQSDQIVHVKEYFEGIKTHENVKIVSQLLLEANHTLGSIMKFPKIYKQFLPYLVNLRKYQALKSIERKLDQVEEQVKKDQQMKLIGQISAMSIDHLATKKESEEVDEDEKIESFKELFDNFEEQVMILGKNPDKMPFDVKGKTPQQLEEMGFEPAGDMEFQVDEHGQVHGVESEDSKQLMEFLNELKRTDKDYDSVDKLNKSDDEEGEEY